MGNIDPFDQCAGSVGDGKYKRPPPLPMTRTERESLMRAKPKSTYIERFAWWWICLMLGIFTIIAVVKGIALIATTFGETAGALAVCVVVCAIIAAIAAKR